MSLLLFLHLVSFRESTICLGDISYQTVAFSVIVILFPVLSSVYIPVSVNKIILKESCRVLLPLLFCEDFSFLPLFLDGALVI